MALLKLDCKLTVLIWDTRASSTLTSFRSDLIDYIEAHIPINDITKIKRVMCIEKKLTNLLI